VERRDCIQTVLIRKCQSRVGADFEGVYGLGNFKQSLKLSLPQWCQVQQRAQS
jgi:hypothetical protein